MHRAVGWSLGGSACLRARQPRRIGESLDRILELFLFLVLRTCHRLSVENVLRNRNVPTTVFPAFLKFLKERKTRTDRFWCTFLFLKNVTRPFFENVLRNKNVPPTVFRMPASYKRGTPVNLNIKPSTLNAQPSTPTDKPLNAYAPTLSNEPQPKPKTLNAKR